MVADKNKLELVHTDNLNYKVGQRYLLHNINWNIKKGERWVVFGLNGSGKTTLLSIIAGYNTFTEGRLEVFGAPYNDENIFENRKRIGFISSSFFDKYYRNETALEIVLAGTTGTFGLTFDITDDQIKRAKQLLQQLGLGEKINQSYVSMSKGERQSVLIARAFVHQPELLILDEPCSGLDVIARNKMLKTIETIAQDNAMTIIFVTHYAEEILPQFNQMLLLSEGKIYAQGTVEELFKEDVLSKFTGKQVQIVQDEYARYHLYHSEKLESILIE